MQGGPSPNTLRGGGACLFLTLNLKVHRLIGREGLHRLPELL